MTTQEQHRIARRLGITPATLRKYQRGDGRVYGRARRIARALQQSPFLLTRQGQAVAQINESGAGETMQPHGNTVSTSQAAEPATVSATGATDGSAA